MLQYVTLSERVGWGQPGGSWGRIQVNCLHHGTCNCHGLATLDPIYASYRIGNCFDFCLRDLCCIFVWSTLFDIYVRYGVFTTGIAIQSARFLLFNCPNIVLCKMWQVHSLPLCLTSNERPSNASLPVDGQVAGGWWQVAGGRWPVAGGRWQPLIFCVTSNERPGGASPPADSIPPSAASLPVVCVCVSECYRRSGQSEAVERHLPLGTRQRMQRGAGGLR